MTGILNEDVFKIIMIVIIIIIALIMTVFLKKIIIHKFMMPDCKTSLLKIIIITFSEAVVIALAILLMNNLDTFFIIYNLQPGFILDLIIQFTCYIISFCSPILLNIILLKTSNVSYLTLIKQLNILLKGFLLALILPGMSLLCVIIYLSTGLMDYKASGH